MLRRLGAVAVLCLALVAATATADPYTHAFDALRTAVAARLSQLSGTLTRAQVREKAVLGRIVAALAAPSAGLAGDLKMARRVAHQVRSSALGESALPSLALEALYGLSGEVRALVAALRDRLSYVPASLKRSKLTAALERIDAVLVAAAHEHNPEKYAAILRAALDDANSAQSRVAKLEKANGVIPCTDDVGGPVTAKIDGTDWVAVRIGAGFNLDASDVVLSASVVAYSGSDLLTGRLIVGVGTDFHGPGEYALGTTTTDVRYTDTDGTYAGVTGSVTITVADVAARRLAGSFDVTTSAVNPRGVARRFTGQFDLTCVGVIRP